MSFPVCIALCANFGPFALDPFAFAIMRGMETVLVLGRSTLEVVDLNIYIRLTECARRRVDRGNRTTETVIDIACRSVSLSVEAMQPQPLDERVPDEVVERVVEHDLEMVVKPVVERTERRTVLERAREHRRPEWIGPD